MFASVRKLWMAMGVVAALGAGSGTSFALPMLDGSMALAALGVTQNKANLGISTLINSTGSISSSPGMGDYVPVPLLTSFGPTVLNLNNLLAYSISNATYGSFATTSGFIVNRDASFLDVYLEGIFTPGPGIPGALPSPTSLRISINQSGKSLAEAITLNSPPLRIPEPASLALVGSGLAGLAIALRRRRSQRA